jgi:hypothetical protein
MSEIQIFSAQKSILRNNRGVKNIAMPIRNALTIFANA